MKVVALTLAIAAAVTMFAGHALALQVLNGVTLNGVTLNGVTLNGRGLQGAPTADFSIAQIDLNTLQIESIDLAD